MKSFLGKLAYGLAFCGLLPLVLIVWAKQTNAAIPLPVPEAPMTGAVAAVLGGLLIGWGMASLWVEGRGLPMNAFPPTRFVSRGLYGLLPHPIYVGASLLSGGLSLRAHSASGLWLVTPVLTLAWLALVYGFENPDLRCRFPDRPTAGAALALPAATPAWAPVGQRLRVAALVLLPWILLYEMVVFLGSSSRPIATFLPCEYQWPVWQWTEVIYLLAYPFAILTPLVLQQQRQLRHFAVAAGLATGTGILLQLALPFVAPPRPFSATSFWGHLLLWERAYDGATAALPSFHVVWAAVAGYFWARRFPGWRWVSYGLALAISLSCLGTGMHSLADVLAGALLAALALRYHSIWHRLRRRTEQLANSWSAYQIGCLRIINHSLYAGLAMFSGVLLAGCLLPTSLALLPPVVLGVVGAGLWGQAVEGASGLSRPFGYYGSLLGGIAGCAVSAVFTPVSLLDMLAACTLVLPLVQGVGRLRCVVQGCCHGRRSTEVVGIRVTHPKSRVCALAHLAGQPVHATPLYSMLANLLLGLLLFRLAYEHVSPSLIVGLYLIGSGLARFVEEEFRGEPQTPYAGGLKLYQWLAFTAVIVGMAVTMLPAPPTQFHLYWQPAALPVALGAALLAAFAMGMDFPFSHKRFSRLAGN